MSHCTLLTLITSRRCYSSLGTLLLTPGSFWEPQRENLTPSLGRAGGTEPGGAGCRWDTDTLLNTKRGAGQAQGGWVGSDIQGLRWAEGWEVRDKVLGKWGMRAPVGLQA